MMAVPANQGRGAGEVGLHQGRVDLHGGDRRHDHGRGHAARVAIDVVAVAGAVAVAVVVDEAVNVARQ